MRKMMLALVALLGLAGVGRADDEQVIERLKALKEKGVTVQIDDGRVALICESGRLWRRPCRTWSPCGDQ
jgi:hypothetical protein